MVNHLRLKGYLSELEGKRKIKLAMRHKQFLNAMLYRSEYLSSLHKLFTEPRLPIDEDTRQSNATNYIIRHITLGPLSKNAARKIVMKLISYGLIEPIVKKSLTDKELYKRIYGANLTKKELFEANLKHAKLFKITDYGIFCYLSQESEVYPSLLVRQWKRKVMRLLLSSYFEKRTVASSIAVQDYRVMSKFLFGALRILNRTVDMIDNVSESEIHIREELNKRKKGKKYRTWKDEEIANLEYDLEWHAKSFFLRLMADTASKDKEKSGESHRILRFLGQDKKFVKLVIDTMNEILSYYRGGKLLELDKTLHP